jgi:hypothetical protein
MGLIWHRMWSTGDHFMNNGVELDKARLTEQLLASGITRLVGTCLLEDKFGI